MKCEAEICYVLEYLMMLIAVSVLNFELTVKINQIGLRHHFEDNENRKLPIFQYHNSL